MLVCKNRCVCTYKAPLKRAMAVRIEWPWHDNSIQPGRDCRNVWPSVRSFVSATISSVDSLSHLSHNTSSAITMTSPSSLLQTLVKTIVIKSLIYYLLLDVNIIYMTITSDFQVRLCFICVTMENWGIQNSIYIPTALINPCLCNIDHLK